MHQKYQGEILHDMIRVLPLFASVAMVAFSDGSAFGFTLIGSELKLRVEIQCTPSSELLNPSSCNNAFSHSKFVGNGELVIAQSIARLDFSWRSAPRETSVLVFQFIVNANSDTLAGAATLLMTGHDVYVVRVRLSNSGNTRLRVYPQNVIAQYRTRSGRGSTRAVPIIDSRFFQPDILEPNYYIDKLVAFVAPANLRDLRVGYSDRYLQVRY